MRYLVAIGGNAITSERSLAPVAGEIGRLSRQGNAIVLTHGNGPQVGKLLEEEKGNLAILTAQTEAEVGLEMQRSLERRGRVARSTIIITRVEVSPSDPEFRRPTKPIGGFLSAGQAGRARRQGHDVRKLAGGCRIVVPSPAPMKVLELGLISRMLSQKYVVIAGGGGGVAVAHRNGKTEYLNAVIDKDRTSALIASCIRADRFVILTNIDGAYTDFSGKNRKLIRKATASEMERHVRNSEFEEGSMLPKVEACIRFVRATGKSAVIGNLEKASEVLSGNGGTVITR